MDSQFLTQLNIKRRVHRSLIVLLILSFSTNVCVAIANRDYTRDITSDDLHRHDTSFHTVGIDHPDHLPAQGVCEPIKIGLCMEVGYNQTTMPNLVGHDAQADADALLQTFTPLIQYGCSAHLKLFLCSAYVPMCTEKVPQPIGPCRSLCESVRRSCEPILTEFGFSWPPSLNCTKFHPENNHQHMCIPGPTEHEQYVFGNPSSPTTIGRNGDFHPGFTSSTRDQGITLNTKQTQRERDPSILQTQRKPINRVNINGNPHQDGADLPFPFSQHHFTNEKVNSILKQHKPVPTSSTENKIANNELINNSKLQNQCFGPRKVWDPRKKSCWIRCPTNSNDNVRMKNVELGHSSGGMGTSSSGVMDENNNYGVATLFQPSERSYARNYVLAWACLSLSAALTAITLSICSPKLSTAERPILYIALCQVLFSVGIIIGSTIPFACFVDRATEMELLAGGGMVPSSCAVVFLLTYFFGTAATLWWVILCLSWLLSVNRRLALSLEQKEWSIFHLATWGISSLLTSAALIHKKVDVDELTGLCGVGYQNTEALTYYNMIPLNICLSKGFLFLLIGIILRHFTSRNNQLMFTFGLEKLKSNNNNGGGGNNCEAQIGHHHHHRQNSLRAPQGYSPVLVLPNNTHNPTCASHGHCVCNNNTNSSPTSGLQLQRIKALQNSKAVWMRVGIFALVYSLPIACQVGTMAYELSGREAWENGRERPNIQIFLLRLNMNLMAGLTTGAWVLSTYSWKSLSSLAQRLCSCRCLWLFSANKKQSQQIKSTIGDVPSSIMTTNNQIITTAPLIPVNSSILFPPPPHNTILSTFQSQPAPNPPNHNHHHHHHQFPPSSVQTRSSSNGNNNFSGGGAVPRHHMNNHPLPPIPPVRTDAWRRGETIL